MGLLLLLLLLLLLITSAPAVSLQVACGSGLALIYEFLLTGEEGNRPGLSSRTPLVRVKGCLHLVATHACTMCEFLLTGEEGNRPGLRSRTPLVRGSERIQPLG